MRNRKDRSTLRAVIAVLVIIVGIILAAYIGGWILFINLSLHVASLLILARLQRL